MKRYIKYLFIINLMFISISVNAEPSNDSFLDDNLYMCIIDTYNDTTLEKKDYSYVIETEELINITALDCKKYAGSIQNLTGLEKMTGLTNLNLSGNTFLGGSLTINEGESGTLKSTLILPDSISLIDKSYSIDNSKIAKIEDGVVTGLKEGTTYITMTAKVSDNEIKEKYLVSVASTAPKSSNANLKSLSLSSGELNFSNTTKSYTTIVNKSITSINIFATTQISKSSFVSGYGPRKVNLKNGSNLVDIKVKAEDGTINTYTIDIIRSDGTDSNNFLSNIELSTGKINFSREVLIYTLNVANDVENIEINAIPESTLSKVTISDTKLKVGENKVTITVLSENKTEQKYEIIITREEYESQKNYLKELLIKGYNIEFSKEVTDYVINIKNDNILKIVATPERSSSSVSIVGNRNLQNNSKITIFVEDENNIKREYNITIKQSAFYVLNYKLIILLIEFITIIILMLVIIFKPKRKIVSRKKSNIIPSNKICLKCGAINNYTNDTCYVCGKELK